MWTTIADLADRLETSRRTVERAIDGDGVVEGPFGPVTITARPVEPADFDALKITRKTTRLVCVVDGQIEREIDARVSSVIDGGGSAEETLRWLEDVRTGREKRVYFASTGEKHTAEFSESARLTAGWQAQKIREYLDERDRNYLPRTDVAHAFAAVGVLFRDRMQSIPSRLADKLTGLRDVTQLRHRLAEAIDEVLFEVADAGERELASLLEGEGDE